jgi:hypothetical protein
MRCGKTICISSRTLVMLSLSTPSMNGRLFTCVTRRRFGRITSSSSKAKATTTAHSTSYDPTPLSSNTSPTKSPTTGSKFKKEKAHNEPATSLSNSKSTKVHYPITQNTSKPSPATSSCNYGPSNTATPEACTKRSSLSSHPTSTSCLTL